MGIEYLSRFHFSDLTRVSLVLLKILGQDYIDYILECLLFLKRKESRMVKLLLIFNVKYYSNSFKSIIFKYNCL